MRSLILELSANSELALSSKVLLLSYIYLGVNFGRALPIHITPIKIRCYEQ